MPSAGALVHAPKGTEVAWTHVGATCHSWSPVVSAQAARWMPLEGQTSGGHLTILPRHPPGRPRAPMPPELAWHGGPVHRPQVTWPSQRQPGPAQALHPLPGPLLRALCPALCPSSTTQPPAAFRNSRPRAFTAHPEGHQPVSPGVGASALAGPAPPFPGSPSSSLRLSRAFAPSRPACLPGPPHSDQSHFHCFST